MLSRKPKTSDENTALRSGTDAPSMFTVMRVPPVIVSNARLAVAPGPDAAGEHFEVDWQNSKGRKDQTC